MPVAIDVHLLTGSYDAGEVEDREKGEWPPHPARLFSALVAAARTDADRTALQWLESQPPPLIRADASADELRREAYVVTNRIEKSGGNLTHPGRTSGLRGRARSMPTTPNISMIWTETPEETVVAALDGLARRVPYLGRSTGVALVSAGVRETEEAPEKGSVFEPCDLLEGDVSLRVPYAGFLDELDAQYRLDRPAWEVARYSGYRLRKSQLVDTGTGEIVPSVYRDVVMFGFSGLRPDGRLTVRFTDALRSAVLRRAGRDAPEVLHGHGANGRPHVAFLGLPDVGGPHSGGHLLGMAVAVPETSTQDRKRIIAAVMGLSADSDGVIELAVKDVGGVGLVHRPGLVRPWGASPERWRQGSRRWVTATPVVLDRYPKRGEDIVDEVLKSVRMVGLPEPSGIRVSRNPLQSGAIDLRPTDLPDKARQKLYRHVELVFDRRVSGPVLLGAGRYLGVGLFAPAAMPAPAGGSRAGGSDD